MRSRFHQERDEPRHQQPPDSPPPPPQALRPGTSNWAIARWLDAGELESYRNTFKSKGLEWQAADDAARIIRKQLLSDNRADYEVDIEVNQILPLLGHPAAAALTAQERIAFTTGQAIDGFAVAIRLEQRNGATQDVDALIDGLDAGNMLTQHENDRARYDRQNPLKKAQNYQIQIGGRRLRTVGKSSVTTVLVADDLIAEFNRTGATADFKAAVVERMRQAHRHSHTSGVQVSLDWRQ